METEFIKIDEHNIDEAARENLKHAGEIIVDTRSALHEILDNTDAFAVVSYNEKLYRHFSYYLKTHRLIIEGCTLTHKFGWIMREDASLSPLAKQFIQMLTAYLA